MENSPLLEETVLLVAAIQVGIVACLSVVIIFRYVKHRNMGHISMVALSYLLLTALTAGSLIYKIFATYPSRTYAAILAVFAFLLGDIALWKVWHSRPTAKDDQTLREIKMRVDQNEARIGNLEAMVAETLAVVKGSNEEA